MNALQSANAYNRSLIEASLDPLVTIGSDGRITDVNTATEKATGYPRQELIGTDFSQYFTEPEKAQVGYEQIFRDGQVRDYELRLRHRDGSSIPVLYNAAVYRDEKGNIVGVFAAARDITFRKKAEEDLIREKNQLINLLHLYQQPDTRLNEIESFVIEECIKITSSRLGFFGFINAEETLMMTHLWSEAAMEGCAIDFKPVEFSLSHAGIWAEAIREHKPLIVNDYEKPDPRKKGYPAGHVAIKRLMSIPVVREAKAVAIAAVANKEQDYDENDLVHLSLYLETIWDMMKRKQSEEALHSLNMELERRVEERTAALDKNRLLLQEIIDNSFAVIYLKDTAGKYILINRRFEELFHVSRATILEKTDYDIFPEDMADAFCAFDRRVLETGMPSMAEETAPHDDGPHTYISIKAPLMDSDGKPYAVCGISTDITERKRDEQEILRLNKELTQKMEQLKNAQEELVRKEKLAILGQLAGIVGHEIRNPLGVMNNAVYFLKAVVNDNDTVKEYLDIIKQEIDNSQHIVSDLLDFSRTKKPQIAPAAVGTLVNDVLGRCNIPESVSVETDIPGTLPEIKVDPFQMGQVLQNLITNAVQAMPEGGTLSISARRISMKEETAGSRSLSTGSGFVEIIVKDTGEGISPENMKKIFQPLFTTKTKGIGLGLVVCKNLTEASGGKIEVESECGKGTTFRLMLPA